MWQKFSSPGLCSASIERVKEFLAKKPATYREIVKAFGQITLVPFFKTGEIAPTERKGVFVYLSVRAPQTVRLYASRRRLQLLSRSKRLNMISNNKTKETGHEPPSRQATQS